MPFEPVLAADALELLTRGIPVILFILWLIGQAISERQKQGRMAQRQERQAQPQPNRPNKPQREAAEIEDEIDAFLRRASEKRKTEPQVQPARQREGERKRDETVILVPPQQDPTQQQQPVVLPHQTPSRRSREAAASQGDRPRTPPARREQRPLSPAPRSLVLESDRPRQSAGLGGLRSSLAPSNSQFSSDLAAASPLGGDKIEAHLHSVFDHQVGRLQHRETIPARRVSGSPLADSVVQMLKDPQGVQQLIVAQEILRRPEL